MTSIDENEIDKTSQRANMIEQRMFEITLSSIDTLKHSTAIEIRKSQNEMKKKLRRYRDRQREIVKSKPGSNKDPIEEMMTRQMQNKASARQNTRPKTCPPDQGRESNRCSVDMETDKQINSDSESDVEIDGSFMIDQQRSKIDLRPKTAMEIVRRGVSLDKYVNIGRLGSPVKQIRYFDEDELKDRGHFYMHLVQKRISDEKNKLNTLDDKVAEFCGKETVQTMNRKMQSKRKFFSKNPEWAENVSYKTKTTLKCKPRNSSFSTSNISNLNKKQGVRPSSTSFGTRGSINIKSFKKPSFISTPIESQ